MPLSSCPVCGGRNFMAVVPAAALQKETREREQFVAERLRRKASRAELKDLTDFMHGDDADILACPRCGLLFREEESTRGAASYEEDPNDPDLMQHVYPRYLDAFRRKAHAYAQRLQPGASVVEIGPHLGGFLQAAEEWNWNPVGLDIGRDTTAFVRSRGLTVRRETAEDTRLLSGSADGVFIWNCFEQLAEPEATLVAARRLLKRHGLLLLRVPNADAWQTLRRQSGKTARRILAWNNLLAFPCLYGYSADSLNRLVRRYGFEPVRAFDSELVTLPFPDVSTRLAQEEREASADAADWSARHRDVGGPWLEILYRREDEIHLSNPPHDRRFLERATATIT